jgi:hypothetical protein
MSIFKAYFDESGTHDDASNIAVAGYISTTKQWKRFGQEWTAILRREGVNVLHRVDLENFRGAFRSWSRDRQVKVTRECHGIIKKHTEKGIGGAVIAVDFDQAMPDVVKRVFGGPYGWLAQECMIGIGHWATDSNQKAFVQYVFEKGARGRPSS